ncbi:MAG: transketolase family protein [Candidatus Devosia euplotis]|nr:transketolase family protein [Candidatus Devosia euplotis]
MASPAPQAVGLFDCRDDFSRTIEELAADDSRIVVVVNDSVDSSKLGGFMNRRPERLVNVGIAEQNMIGVGADLANGGKIPFVSGASCFLTARSLEQIKADATYSNANVKLCGISSGVAYGELRPTHRSIEDMAWLRPLTNLTIIVPADPWETAEAVRFAARHDGPVFIRISRMPVSELKRDDAAFAIGKAETLRQGDHDAIIANGAMVHRALAAAEILAAENINARVVNMSSISPLDEAAIIAAAETGAVVTVEEHNIHGGLGGAVAEVLATTMQVPMGFPGFAPTGSAAFLMEHFGLTALGIADKVRATIAHKAG